MLEIVQVGDPVLRKTARPLSVEEIGSEGVQNLIASMWDAMRTAPGVGLAAPQVGISLQLAVIEDRPEYLTELSAEALERRGRRPVPFHVVINPRLSLGDESVDFFEGCLSLAGFTAVTPRARSVRVECLNERAEPTVIEAEGWYARILQHEIDHLNGHLYIDRMRLRSFSTVENYRLHWKDRSDVDKLWLAGEE